MKRNRAICRQCPHRIKWQGYSHIKESEYFCNRNYREFDHKAFRNWHRMDVPPLCPFRMEHKLSEWNDEEKA